MIYCKLLNYVLERRCIAVDIRLGDILVMKKPHPGCGSTQMLVQRVGADFRLCCKGCGHSFMIPRSKCEKKIRSVLRETENSEG